MPEVKLTILVDDQGTIKIKTLAEDLAKLERAAKQSGTGLAAAGGQAAAASKGYEQMGASVAMAQAKLLALYGAVRGAQSLFTKGMESIDYYEKAIIRMAASATDALRGAQSEAELQAYYDRMKGQFRGLVEYAQEASAKYFANAREMLQVMEWAVARGYGIDRKTIDNIGLFIDKIKQLVPWIKQEGQVLQELNALWEGHARMTDTMAKLVIDRLKQTGQITATETKEIQEQFQKILAGWKEDGFSGFMEKVMGLFQGAKIASKDIQNTWESVLETLGSTIDRLLNVAGKEVYKDIITYLQQISEEYLTGAQAAEKQAQVAKVVSEVWRTVKGTLADLRPVLHDIGTFLGEAWKFYSSLPDEIREIGLIAFILVGTKGKAVLLAVAGLLGRIQTLLDSFRAYKEGTLGLGELFGADKGRLDEAIEKLKEIERRRENLRQFEEMEPLPKTKSPIKLMSWEGDFTDQIDFLGETAGSPTAWPIGPEKGYAATVMEMYRSIMETERLSQQERLAAAKSFQQERLAQVDQEVAAIRERYQEIPADLVEAYKRSQILQINREISDATRGLSFDWEAAWKRAAENVQDALSNMIYNLITNSKSGADVLKNLLNGLTKIFSDLAAQSIMGMAKSWLGGGGWGGSGGVYTEGGGLIGWIGGLFKSWFGAEGGVLPGGFYPLGQIPQFATGGIFDRPTLGVIGERGPEAVVPLDRYEVSRKGESRGDVHIINVWDPAMVSEIAARTMASGTGRQIILNVVGSDLAERGVTMRQIRR